MPISGVIAVTGGSDLQVRQRARVPASVITAPNIVRFLPGLVSARVLRLGLLLLRFHVLEFQFQQSL